MSEVLTPAKQDNNLSPKLNLRRLETIQRWLQVGAILILLVFVSLIVLSWLQLRQINQQIAQKKTELADLQKEAANLKAKNAVYLKVVNNLTTAASEGDTKQVERQKRSIEDSISLTASPYQIPARIYLQVGREDQRKRASEVARQLQAKNFIVPGLEENKDSGVENVRGRAPRVSQIRFYQDDDVSQKDVNDIVGVLRGMGIELKQVRLPASANVRPRHYEIWFGDDF